MENKNNASRNRKQYNFHANNNGYLGMSTDEETRRTPATSENPLGLRLETEKDYSDAPLRQRRNHIIIIAVLCVVLAIIAGVLIWAFARSDKNEDDATDNSTLNPPVQQETPDEETDEPDDMEDEPEIVDDTDDDTATTPPDDSENLPTGPTDDTIDSIISAFSAYSSFDKTKTYNFNDLKFYDGASFGYENATTSIIVENSIGGGGLGIFYKTPVLGWQFYYLSTGYIDCALPLDNTVQPALNTEIVKAFNNNPKFCAI